MATAAASTAAALERHLVRQQQKMMVARTSNTTPPTTAIAMIAPVARPVLVEPPVNRQHHIHTLAFNAYLLETITVMGGKDHTVMFTVAVAIFAGCVT